MARSFWRKEDYEGDTDENIHNTDDSSNENDDFVKTWTNNKNIKKRMNNCIFIDSN